ncbi:MAG: hypothetical protein SFT92_06275 [Rickettsiales bacterium]|nr:hypothetical protein [Rickettsiales bacterium]
MKSIFFLAARQLQDWQQQGYKRADIERALAAHTENASPTAPLPADYLRQVDGLHNEFNVIYYSNRAPRHMLDADLELPDDNRSGTPVPETRAQAERNMRWGAMALIAEIYHGASGTEHEAPFNILQQRLDALYTLCFPKNSLEWKTLLSGLQRKGWSRTLRSPQDAGTVTRVMNDILFPAYGCEPGIQLRLAQDNPCQLLAKDSADFALNDVIRVEESRRHRDTHGTGRA